MRWCVAAFLLSLSTAQALEVEPAGGAEVARDQTDAGSVRLPEAAWQPGVTYSETTGAVRRRAFQIPNPTLTTLQLSEPLRIALEEAGYSEIFSCANRSCGGFDFRFQLDLLPPPAMYVDLGNFRYLLMANPEASAKLVSIVTSSSTNFGYVHVTEVLDEILATEAQTEIRPAPVPSVAADDMIERLLETGHVVLADLEFGTGSAELGAGPFPSLQRLSEWLAATPGARVVLVGHSDSVGSLDANLSLSQRRAASVMARLTSELDVPQNQVFSDGAGALSPIASNLTPEGRAQNRRVEVVLLEIE